MTAISAWLAYPCSEHTRSEMIIFTQMHDYSSWPFSLWKIRDKYAHDCAAATASTQRGGIDVLKPCIWGVEVRPEPLCKANC